MPQLDFIAYSSEVIWFVIIFIVLYFVLIREGIPKIYQIFKLRLYILDYRKKISANVYNELYIEKGYNKEIVRFYNIYFRFMLEYLLLLVNLFLILNKSVVNLKKEIKLFDTLNIVNLSIYLKGVLTKFSKSKLEVGKKIL